MKKNIFVLLALVGLPLSLALAVTQTNLSDLTTTVVDAGSSKLNDAMHKSSMPEWLQRTDLGITLQQKNKPEFELESIQPFWKDQLRTLFWQGRVAYKGNDTTLNFGTGYRYLTQNQNWMFGGNVFVDEAMRYAHRRVGFGAEIFQKYGVLRGNYYLAITGQKNISVDSSVTTYEKALSGYDYSLETPLPYLPWMRLILTGYHWDGYLKTNINGGEASLRMDPLSNLELTLGSGKETGTGWRAFLNASWYLDRPAFIEYRMSDQLFSQTAFTAADLSKHRLEKVRRHNDVVVERGTISGSAGTFIIKRGT
ncbi:MAG: inverse autotransporter beta domain-containing protein [Gammaproteobacteria bacterium]